MYRRRIPSATWARWAATRRGGHVSDSIRGVDVEPVTAWFEANIPGATGPLSLRPDRRRPLEPHLLGHGRRRAPLRPAPPAAGPRAGHRPRHGPRAQDHLGPGAHRRSRRARPRPVHRRDGERRALLRHGLRRRSRSSAMPRRSAPSPPRPAPTRATPWPTRWPRIHAVDPDAVGLGDLGKKEDYILRQLKRWYGQWEKSKTRELRVVDEVHDALQARVPGAGPRGDRPRRLPPRQLHGRRRRQHHRRARLGDLHARRSAWPTSGC